MERPRTAYALSGDVHIAWQQLGDGHDAVVLVPGFISNVELHWEDPGYTHLLRRLAAMGRVVQFDKRGTGLSDREAGLPTLETRMDDVRAVMDAAGIERAALLGASEGGPMAILFAATFPERTRALLLYGAYAHFHAAVMNRERLGRFIASAEAEWGTGRSLGHFAPGLVRDPHFSDWWARYERMSCSPAAAVRLARMNAMIDVRPVLASIRVPTLVLHRRDDARVSPAAGRYLATHIPGAKHVVLEGRDHPLWVGDVDAVVDQIEAFLNGLDAVPPPRHQLATVLAAQLDGSGDLRGLAVSEIARWQGEPIEVRGRAILARFDGPGRAVRCAMALADAAGSRGLGLRCGVHAGALTRRGRASTGRVLTLARRIATMAGMGKVLVSRTVADLAAGGDPALQPAGKLDLPDEGGSISLLAPRPHLPVADRVQVPGLSAREVAVLALLARGLSNAEIACELGLSPHTAKRHVANILTKLALDNRAAAAAVAARQGLG